MRVVRRDPAGGIEEDRLGADIGAHAAAAQQCEAGLEAADEMRVGPRPAIDDDQAVEPFGAARASARPMAPPAAWPTRVALARPRPSISASTSPAMSSTLTLNARSRLCARCRDDRRE